MSSRQKWDWAFDKILMVSTKDFPIYLATYIVSKLSLIIRIDINFRYFILENILKFKRS